MSYRTAARRVTMQSLVRSSPLKRRAADKVREVAQMIRRGERIGVTSASLIERLRRGPVNQLFMQARVVVY